MTEQIDQARQALRLALPLLERDRTWLAAMAAGENATAALLARYDTAIAACRQALGEDA